MVEIKRLTDCTFNEALTAWNTGFEEYFVNLTMDIETFLRRFPAEDLSPSMSVVAFVDGEPAGLIVNGIRTIKGVKTAWNGGTAVAVKFRKKGVGRALMQATLDLYKQEGVQLAMLEAIKGNDKAITLYESLGYETVDELEFLELKGKLAESPFPDRKGFSVKKAYPAQVGNLSFYKGGNPWQTHWQSAKDAEAIIMSDENGKDVGYAYFKKAFNGEGVHISTTLCQCEADESREDAKEILQALLMQVFGSFEEDIRRVVLNLPKERSRLTHETLKDIGFTPFAYQVMMNREME
ncbi:GNAT family N-acetyltransferase [Neobacillus piezotolerans]|nr:GNAT family N-acetyltransferase [Neobacillus piezotolerans]